MAAPFTEHLIYNILCSPRKKGEDVRQSSLPPCVQNLVRQFLTKSASDYYENCSGDIYSYIYKGKTVYLFPLNLEHSATICRAFCMMITVIK